MTVKVDRRAFLKTTCAASASLAFSRALPAAPERDRSLFAINTPLATFAYGDVKLHDGPMKNAGGDWVANAVDGSQITMRPFMSIDKETYSAYVRLKS